MSGVNGHSAFHPIRHAVGTWIGLPIRCVLGGSSGLFSPGLGGAVLRDLFLVIALARTLDVRAPRAGALFRVMVLFTDTVPQALMTHLS